MPKAALPTTSSSLRLVIEHTNYTELGLLTCCCLIVSKARMAQMGQLQTDQLERQDVQKWRARTLPDIRQPVDLWPCTFCVFYQLPVSLAERKNSKLKNKNRSDALKLFYTTIQLKFNKLNTIFTGGLTALENKNLVTISMQLLENQQSSGTKNKRLSFSRVFRSIMVPPSKIVVWHIRISSTVLKYSAWKSNVMHKTSPFLSVFYC